MKTKSTFSFDKAANAKLQNIANSSSTSKSEVLRRAITLYDYLLQNAHDEGHLTITKQDGEQIRLLIP